MKIDVVREGDIDDLLPLMRAYSEFYEVHAGRHAPARESPAC